MEVTLLLWGGGGTTRVEVTDMQRALTALEQRHAEEKSAYQVEQRDVQTLLKVSCVTTIETSVYIYGYCWYIHVLTYD